MPSGCAGTVTLTSFVSGRTQRGQPVDVEAPAVLEAQVDDVEVGADRPRRLEVGGVVGAHHHGVVAGLEQRVATREERGGGARGDEHVVGVEAVAGRRDRLAQERVAEVVAVAEQQVVEVEVEAEVVEAPVGDRALGEVVGDRVVAQLLGRLDLDGHPAVAHAASLAGLTLRRRQPEQRRR